MSNGIGVGDSNKPGGGNRRQGSSYIEVLPPVSPEVRVHIDPLVAQELRQSGRWNEFIGELGGAVAVGSEGLRLTKSPQLGFGLSFSGRDCVVTLTHREEGLTNETKVENGMESYERAKALVADLTLEDAQCLETLFRSKLFTEDSFGYVLLFEKPASMISPSRLNEEPGKPYDLEYDQTLQEGVEVWERVFGNRSDFCFRSTKYLAKTQDGEHLPNRFFISKSKTTTVIQENLEVFQALLNSNESAERIFERMMASNADFEAIIKDDLALGLLLGFGRENAEGYAQLEEAFWGADEVSQAELMDKRILLHDSRLENDPSISELHKAGKGVGQFEYAVFTGIEDARRLKLKYSQQRVALKELLSSDDFLVRIVDRVLSLPHSA